jgi:hypothetical protein
MLASAVRAWRLVPTAARVATQTGLALAILAGVWARVAGLPLHVADSGDEYGNTVAPLRALYEHGDPNVFLHPALYYYVTAAAYAVTFPVAKVLGVVEQQVSMTDLFVRNPRLFVHAARGVSLISAGLALGALYVFGRTMWSRTNGLAAAALLAMVPLHVFYSNTVRVDSLFVFVFVCAFDRIVRLVQDSSRRAYVVAGLLAGLATGTNYNGGILLPWLVGAHLLRRPTGVSASAGAWRNLGGALVIAGLAFLASNPFALLNQEIFVRNLSHQLGLLSVASPGWESRDPLHYLRRIAADLPHLGALVAVSSVAVVLFGTRRERFVLSLPVAYAVLFSLMQTRDERFILPALALFLLIAGGMPFVLARRLAAWPAPRAAATIASYGLIGLCIWNLAPAALTVPPSRPHEVLAWPDVLLFNWIETNVPPDSAILVELGILPLADTLKEPGRLAAELRRSLVTSRPGLDQRFVGAVYIGGRTYDPAAVEQRTIDYAIVSARNVDYIERHCDTYAEVCAFYEALRRRARIVFQTPQGYEPALVWRVAP